MEANKILLTGSFLQQTRWLEAAQHWRRRKEQQQKVGNRKEDSGIPPKQQIEVCLIFATQEVQTLCVNWDAAQLIELSTYINSTDTRCPTKHFKQNTSTVRKSETELTYN